VSVTGALARPKVTDGPTATAVVGVRASSSDARALGLVLLAASLGLFMAFADLAIVNIAFPDVEHSFQGVTLAGLSWVLSGYSIVAAAFMAPFGRLADLLGRKRVYMVALAVFTLASALCATAPSVSWLIAGRVLQGLGVAALTPTGFALVMAAFPPEKRVEAISISAAVAALAAGISPALGGLLVHLDSWRLVFLVNLPIGVTALALSSRVLRESRGARPKAFPDLLGALLFALAIGALALAIVQGQSWGWASARVLGAFAAAAALMTAFVFRSRRQAEPLFDRSLVRCRPFVTASTAHAVAMAGFFGYTLVNVLFLTTVWNYSLLQAGGALTPGPLIAAFVGALSSRLVARTGFAKLLVPGGLLWAAAIVWLVSASGTQPDFVGVWLPAVVVGGIGAGLIVPLGASAAITAAPGDRFGAASGLQQVTRSVGAAIGVAVAVAILSAQSDPVALTGYHTAWLLAAGCIMLGGVASLTFGIGARK
jgi:NTE family protein